MMLNKRNLLLVGLFVLVSSLMLSSADAGPKPSIEIVLSHVPGSVCYVDLLVDDIGSKGDFTREIPEGEQGMFEMMRGIDDKGWIPAVSNGIGHIMSQMKCDLKEGAGQISFVYRTPDRFKVVVVTDTGEIAISDIIEKTSFSSRVYFDFATGKAYEESPILQVIKLLPFTYLITVIIELIVLFSFGFGQKRNIVTLLTVNGVTQMLLMASVGYGNYGLGFFGAFILAMFAEFAIFIVEAIWFAKALVGYTKGRRIWFSLTANLCSLMLGTYLIGIVMIYFL